MRQPDLDRTLGITSSCGLHKIIVLLKTKDKMLVIIIISLVLYYCFISFQKKCTRTDDSVLGCEPRVTHSMCPGSETLSANKIRARHIDELSRFCFPLTFAVFNLFYWSYYLS
jgi:hypothetical protein